MKIAIIHDWLVTYAGAEKVLEQLINCYPDADLFSMVDFIPGDKRSFINNKKVATSFIQKMPFARKKYRTYLPLMPFAVEQFNLTGYDLIISSSYAVAKGIIIGPNQTHICYCHSPMRYAWDLQYQYLKESGLNRGLKGLMAKRQLHKLRAWDLQSSFRVDKFIANSDFIAKRIKKVYRRNSTVINPPVDIENFTASHDKEDFYLTASRMVPYKKIDLIVEAFSKMPDKKLIVIGDGPDMKKISNLASNNISMVGYQDFASLKSHMQRAKAFVFAAEEDFGIVPVEAQACGTPVIAFGKGGALETVNSLDSDLPTGIFFDTQTITALTNAVDNFENNIDKFTVDNCRKNAEKFSNAIFREKIKNFVTNNLTEK